MNADGIYLATYAALLLNLKLIRINYYHDEDRQIPVSEVCLIASTRNPSNSNASRLPVTPVFAFKEQFVEEVHGSGVLVYLSATWLSELYQQVLACNLLEKCGYNPSSTENNALVNVLTGTQHDISAESIVAILAFDCMTHICVWRLFLYEYNKSSVFEMDTCTYTSGAQFKAQSKG
jgi:hypothetical protein